MSATPDLLASLRASVAFEPVGEAVGNLTIGRGTLAGAPLHVALVESLVASGSLGTRECARLGALLRVVASERSRLVLYLDSAGARVSEGLAALGAFRDLYRAGLEAAYAGAPVAAVLGRNCFGGASMLAHLAGRRLMGEGTQMAMSGPSVIASIAGMDPLDEMFRAMAQATMSAAARAKVNAANTVWQVDASPATWLSEALAAPVDATSAFHDRHQEIRARLPAQPDPPWESVRRRDLEKIYASNDARESDGLLEGTGVRDGSEESFIGIVGRNPLGAARAWRFADLVWRHMQAPPRRLEVYLDCATHAARLDDEKAILTEFVVDMGFALAALARRNTDIGLTVLGKAGGGVYVALAAPARRVASVHGADIQVLPGAAVAAILGHSGEAAPAFEQYRAAHVADEEYKLGIVPGTS